MNFGQIIDRSLRLVRNHTVLWKLGLLAVFTEGLTGGLMSMPPTPGGSTKPAEEAEMVQMFEQAMVWIRDHQTLTVALILTSVVLLLVTIYLSIRAKAGLISSIADLENKKTPNRFRDEFRRGGQYVWRLIGLYVVFGFVLSIILGVPTAILTGILLVLNDGAAWALFVLMIPVFLAIAGYAHLVMKFAERAIVLGNERIWSALGTAHRLLFGRPGKSALAVIVEIGVQIIFILLIFAIIIIAIGLAALLAIILASVLPATIVGAVVGAVALLFLGGFFLLGGWFAAFTVSYWTLIYQRLATELQATAV